VSRTALAVPRWAVATTFVLSLIGLGLSIYMTIAHFEGTQILACSESGLFNCAKVTTSKESYFLGVPVAILGLVNFVVMTALNSPWGWRARFYWLHVARFVLTIGAMIFVLWLLSAELLIINNICYYCTGVHIVTFALLIVMSRVCPTQLGWTRSVAT
jgi:uncharacterized membrane protein